MFQKAQKTFQNVQISVLAFYWDVNNSDFAMLSSSALHSAKGPKVGKQKLMNRSFALCQSEKYPKNVSRD